MQSSKERSTNENFANLTAKTFHDLDEAKKVMEQNEVHLKELANQTTKRFGEEMKVNAAVMDKIVFLQDLVGSLSEKNEELEKANKELENQKSQNAKLTTDLRSNLEKVVLKEKELELQRDHLARQVNEKTDELVKSEKLAVIGEMASRMAHEMRNPLSTIKNVIEVIESKPRMKVEEKLLYYGKLRRAIDRMTHQVDDVLDFVRITEISLKSHPVYSLVTGARDNIIIPNDVTINIEESNATVFCDERKMLAVFTNLMLNAIQATGTIGTINVRIIDHGENVMIAFEDSGAGIPENIFDKIFDPLYTTKQTGTGLGLSICKNIVNQHGGNISVKNNPTTFIVRLPKNSI